MARPGRSGALTRAWGLEPVRRLVPHPMIWPQYMTTRKIPSPMIEIIVAVGTFRRGFEVSSARGAAASQPVKACKEKTIAKSESFSRKAVGGNPAGEVETAGPRAGKAGQSEGEDDRHLREPQADEHLHRERQAPPGEESDKRSADDQSQPP